jgi:hypothetical protein
MDHVVREPECLLDEVGEPRAAECCRRQSAADARPGASRRRRRGRRPDPAGARSARRWGFSCTPAPASRSAEACSNTRTSKPARSNDSAAVRPPMPAPTMPTLRPPRAGSKQGCLFAGRVVIVCYPSRSAASVQHFLAAGPDTSAIARRYCDARASSPVCALAHEHACSGQIVGIRLWADRALRVVLGYLS